MKNLFLLATTLACLSGHAQYYYNDILGTIETNRQMRTYLDNKVLEVKATGTDANGQVSPTYSELQEVRENGRALKISTLNNGNSTIFYNRFDEQGRLVSITDSSTVIQSVTTYEYDATGKIIRVQNSIRDSANDFTQVELHYWTYSPSGQPEKMWRTINNGDSLEFRFTPDEFGNTGDERSFRNSVETSRLYYYYDNKKRLTDIVRFNTRMKKLMPDIMFEYDENDRVVQKITTTSSLNLGYLIWRYIFDEKGLKTKEALFNNDKELTGRIDFRYRFGS